MGNNLTDDLEVLLQLALPYKDLLKEYCTLASQPTLQESGANRLEEILQQAQSEPVLDFLIDEADHILGHELGLIKEEFIQHQQQELKKCLDRLWCERLLQNISSRKRSEAIQKYLQDKGFYTGAIDGKIGPRTYSALKLLKQENNLDEETTQLLDAAIQSAY
ncbi:MAG: peptidoglycan-binding domain-containing protein [Coleofasciculaceae cyanobacterium]